MNPNVNYSLRKIIERQEKPNMTTCEVGCWIGNTTKVYLDIIKKNNGKAIVVDWFCGSLDIPDWKDHEHFYRPENQEGIYQQFMNNIQGYHDCVKVLKGKSSEMVDQIEDESLDICFIDADHSYESVRSDIQLYLPKVKKGGLLCGHDCEYIEMANTFSAEELKMPVGFRNLQRNQTLQLVHL
jgi:hypothetical protein